MTFIIYKYELIWIHIAANKNPFEVFDDQFDIFFID